MSLKSGSGRGSSAPMKTRSTRARARLEAHVGGLPRRLGRAAVLSSQQPACSVSRDRCAHGRRVDSVARRRPLHQVAVLPVVDGFDHLQAPPSVQLNAQAAPRTNTCPTPIFAPAGLRRKGGEVLKCRGNLTQILGVKKASRRPLGSNATCRTGSKMTPLLRQCGNAFLRAKQATDTLPGESGSGQHQGHERGFGDRSA